MLITPGDAKYVVVPNGALYCGALTYTAYESHLPTAYAETSILYTEFRHSSLLLDSRVPSSVGHGLLLSSN